MKDLSEDSASPLARAEDHLEGRIRRISAGFYGLLALAMTIAIGFGSVWSGEFFARLASSSFLMVSGVLYLLYFLVDADLLPPSGGAGQKGGRSPPGEDLDDPHSLSVTDGLLANRRKLLWIRPGVRLLFVFVSFEVLAFSAFLTFLAFR